MDVPLYLGGLKLISYTLNTFGFLHSYFIIALINALFLSLTSFLSLRKNAVLFITFYETTGLFFLTGELIASLLKFVYD